MECTKAGDRVFNLKQDYMPIVPHADLCHTLIVDSKGLYDTISTIYKVEDYSLKVPTQRVGVSFGSGDIDVLRLVHGKRALRIP